MKKYTCIFLVVIIAFSCISASAMSDSQRSDLRKFGIMVGDPNGDMRLDDSVTRAEAAKIICSAGKLTKKAGNITPFPDVSESHWAYEYIMTAKSHDIVAGDENGLFNPDATVTNEEFVKMAVCLVGYSEYAYYQGGFPAGYIGAGTMLGITKNLQLDINVPATRNNVGIMIYNTLDVKLLAVDEKQSGENQLVLTKSDKTLRDNF